jgi:hypothetical protein
MILLVTKCYSDYQKEDEMVHVAHMEVYRVLAVKPEGKNPPGRHRYVWPHNIKMDLKEIE